jgi:hypothetical protein
MPTETNLMAGTWTDAAKVRRAVNAGPRRKTDLEFEDMEDAVLAAYVSFRDLRKEMSKAGLSERDARAAFVLMTAEFEGAPFNAGHVTLLTIPRNIAGLHALLNAAKKHANKGEMAPLGVVFWQRDRDERAKESKPTWVQSWRVDVRSLRAAGAVRDKFKELGGDVPEGDWSVQFDEL